MTMTDSQDRLLDELAASLKATLEDVSLLGTGKAKFLYVICNGRSAEVSWDDGHLWLEFWDSLDPDATSVGETTVGTIEEAQAVLVRRLNPPKLTEALHSAARLGQRALIRTLIERGASVEAPSAQGAWRPIHTAVEHGQMESIRELVANGADVNAKADGGMTPLHLAVDVVTDSLQQVGELHALPVIKLLITLGADSDAKNDEGLSPRDWARKSDIRQLDELFAD